MLPRAARLKRNKDFRAVYAQRRSVSCASLVLYVRAKRQGPVRIGFVITKKVAKRAHDRNLLKRRLREICRLNVLPRVRTDLVADVLIAARTAATEFDYTRLAADVESLGRQAGLF
jgi:ribonuclease P protein component